MKYEKEVDEILEYLSEDWMDENEKEEYIREILIQTNSTRESMNADFEKGIANGQTIEKQMTVAKYFIDHYKKKNKN